MSIAILGGGISGLSTAYYVSNALENCCIRLFESTNRVGGWINSVRTKNGALFEVGPRSLRCEKKVSVNTLDLIESIGLKSSIVPVLRKSKTSKNKFIYYDNQLIVLPSGIMSWFKINPSFINPFWKAILRDWKTPKKTVKDESVYDFVCRRLGQDYAENVFSAMVCGVFAGDAKEISVKALMEDFFKLEQEYGSIIRGLLKRKQTKVQQHRSEFFRWSAFTFENGLESLPKQLQNHLMQKQNIAIELETECSKLEFQDGIPVMTVGEVIFTSNHVFSTLPSKDLARILTSEHSFLKSELLATPFVSVAVVNLEFEGDLLEKKGFGFLVPPNQKLPILGVSYDSCIHNQTGKTVLTAMMGGRWFEEYFGSDPTESSLLTTAKDLIRKTLNINEEPINTKVSILKNCIPQYVVGHKERVAGMREYIAKKNLKLSLVGSSYDGIGIHDAIFSAKENVEKTFKSVY